jgi:Caspase domain
MKSYSVLILIGLLIGLSPLMAQQETEKRKEVKKVDYSQVKNFDVSYLSAASLGDIDLDFVVGDAKNYLLLIAVDKYKYWKSLANPVKDARDLKKILMEKYGFEAQNIFELYNEEATPENIREAFESLKNKGTNVDNLLIYYSGHGYYDPSFDLGYWVPSDGRTNSGSVSTYIPNDAIRNYIKSLEFRHVFMIADACFSGSLFDTAERRGEAAEKMEAIKSRWGLSSGNLELVSDGEKGKNSPFATFLIKYLQENLQDKLRVSELVGYVTAQVKSNTQQSPIGNRLSGVGDEGGEFIFTLQGTSEPAPTEKPKTEENR